MLELGHEFAIETTHGVSGEEPVSLGLKMGVDLVELGHQGVLTRLVFLDQHKFELAVHILYDSCYFFILPL